MHGLMRVVLIDSFITGKRVFVDTDGHTTINGRNGSGKTSFLKLLSIFYGAEPRQVENKAGGKDSFVDWYLPRSTSLIIYEYERADGLCCLVLYRHPTAGTAKPAYRFMKGEFTPERFSVLDSAGAPVFCRGRELRAHWQSQALTFSRQIEIVTDFRAIIQNDTVLLRRSTMAAESKRLARDYSLGDGRGTMQHIEKVCTAIQNQHGNLERMKDMLADIMFREGVVIPEPPRHPENLGIANRVRWLTSFDKELPGIRTTLLQNGDLVATESHLISLHVALKRAKGDISAQVGLLDEQFKEYIKQIGDEKNRWGEQYATLQESLAKFTAQEKQVEDDLDNLYRQQESYEGEEIESKKRAYDDLERLTGLMEQTKSRVNLLNQNISNERQPFTQREKDETERHIRANSRLRDRHEAVAAALGKLGELYRERENNINQRREMALESKREEGEPERQRVVAALAAAEVRAKTATRTDEEELILTQISTAIETLRREIEAKLDTLHTAEESGKEVKGALDRALDDRRRHKSHLDGLKADQDRLRKLLYPEDGSWLTELRRCDPAWVNGIGRMVNPELLERKDLKPVYHGTADSIYGWDVDLTVITPTDAAESDEELRARFADAEEQVAAAEHELEQLEKRARGRQKDHQEAIARITQLSRERQQLEQRAASQEKRRGSEERRIADASAERRARAKREAEDLTRQLKRFDENHAQELLQIKTDFHDARQENQSAEAIERSRLENERDDIGQQLAEEKSSHKRAITSIWSDFDKVCSKQGIDIETLNTATEELKQARAMVERVQGYRTVIAEYDNWLETRWSHCGELQSQLNEHKTAVRETTSEIGNARTHHNSQLGVLETGKRGTEARLVQTRELLSNIVAKLEEIGEFPVTVEPEAAEGSAPHLLSEATDAIDLLKKQQRKVISGIAKAEAAITASGDDQITSSWRQMVEELESVLGKEFSEDPNRWRHLPPLLEQFINDVVPSKREALIQTIRGVGGQLSEYFHGLKQADRSILKYSHVISKAIVESLDVEALSDVNIRLASRIKDLDFWVRLELFVKEWVEWSVLEHDELPSSDLVEAMGAALLIIEKVKSGNDLRALFGLSLEIRENGRLAIIKSDNDLAHASSRGLSYLALCGIFIGITHYLCRDRKTDLHWPVDELEVIDGVNINRLFGMLDRANIKMVAGFPSKDANLLRLFKRHHVIHLREGVRVMNPSESDLLSQLKRGRAINGEVRHHG